MLVGFLMGGGAIGQFQGQIGGKELLQGKSEEKRAAELSRVGQSRIRRAIAFHSRVLFEGVKTR